MYTPFQELKSPQEIKSPKQDFNTIINNNIESSQKIQPKGWVDLNEEQRLSDYMLSNGFSQEDYLEVRNKKRADAQLALEKDESDESFFKKLYVEPMTDEDIRASEDFFSKETVLNQWEWFAKNVVWWLANIVTWLWDIVVKWVKWTPWAISWATEYAWDVLTWEKELSEVWEDISTTASKVWEVAKAIWNHYKKTYWSLEWFQEQAMENPVWIIWDVLTVMTGWAAIASKINKVQKASLLAQKGAYTDAMVNAVWLEAKKQVMMNSIKISEQILKKTKNIKSLSKWIEIANKFNPYLAWPKLAWQTAKLWPKLVWVWADALHLTPKKLIASTMKLKPSDMARINNMIGKEWDFTNWLTEKGIIRGSKITQGREWIVTKLQDFNTHAYDTLNDAIKWVKWTFTNTNVEKWLIALEKQFKWVLWLEDDLVEIQQFIAKYKAWGLTLREITKIKRKIDNNLSLYKATWAAKEWTTKAWLVKVRQWIREFIEDIGKKNNIKNIQELSNDIRVSRWIGDALVERIATSDINRIVNLSDSLLSIPLLAWVDPTTMALYFIGKKIFETPAFKLSILKWAYQFPKDLINKVKNWIALTEQESLQYWALMSKYVKDRWAKLKTDLKELWASAVDDLADKTKVRSKFIQEGGKSLDDFKTVWTTKSAAIKDKAADIFDELADLTGARSKLTWWESSSIIEEIWRHFFGWTKRTSPTTTKTAPKPVNRASSTPSNAWNYSWLSTAESDAARKALNLKEIQAGLDRATKVSEKSSTILPTWPKASAMEKIKEAGSLKARAWTQFTDTTTDLSKKIHELSKNLSNMTQEEFLDKMDKLIRNAKFKKDIVPVTKNIAKLYVLTQVWEDDGLFSKIMNILTPTIKEVDRLATIAPIW